MKLWLFPYFSKATSKCFILSSTFLNQKHQILGKAVQTANSSIYFSNGVDVLATVNVLDTRASGGI